MMAVQPPTMQQSSKAKGHPVTPNVAELPRVALKLTTFGRMSCCCMSSNMFKALSHCKPPGASASMQTDCIWTAGDNNKGHTFLRQRHLCQKQ